MLRTGKHPTERNRRPEAQARQREKAGAGEIGSPEVVQDQATITKKKKQAMKKQIVVARVGPCGFITSLLLFLLFTVNTVRIYTGNTAWCKPVELQVTHVPAVINSPNQLINMTRDWMSAVETLVSLHGDNNEKWSRRYTPDVATLCGALLASHVRKEAGEESKHIATLCADIEFHLANADATFGALVPQVGQWPVSARAFMRFLGQRVDKLASHKNTSAPGHGDSFFCPLGYRDDGTGDGQMMDKAAVKALLTSRRLVEGGKLTRTCFPTTNIDGMHFSAHLTPRFIDGNAVALRKLFAQSSHPWRHAATQRDRVLGVDTSKIPLDMESWPAPSSSSSTTPLSALAISAVEREFLAQIRRRRNYTQKNYLYWNSNSPPAYGGGGTWAGLFYSLASAADGIDELLGFSSDHAAIGIPSQLLSRTRSHSASLHRQTTAVLTALLQLRAIEHQADTLHTALARLTSPNVDPRLGWVHLEVRSGHTRLRIPPPATVTHWRFLHPGELKGMFGEAEAAAERVGERVEEALATTTALKKVLPRREGEAQEGEGGQVAGFVWKWAGHLGHERQGPWTPLAVVNLTIHTGFEIAEKGSKKEKEEALREMDKVLEESGRLVF